MLNWRIYYGDGSTFSSWDGQPGDAPALNVQAIASEDLEIGRRTASRYDFYWFDAGAWYGGDLFGLFDYLQRVSPSIVKFGRAVPRATFTAILARAIADIDLLPKTADDPSEHLG